MAIPRFLKLSAGLAICVVAAVAVERGGVEVARSQASETVNSATPALAVPPDDGCPPDMVLFAGGEFDRADEPLAPFCLARQEVTVAQYRRCVEAGVCAAPEDKRRCNFRGEDVDDHAVNCVTWAAADTYCSWRRARLPTQWEWEWAGGGGARARSHPWGEVRPDPTRANLCFNECRRQMENLQVTSDTRLTDGWVLTAPVGSYPRGRSPEGLDDMIGNVGEWTSTPVPQQDGHYVFRGASWYHHQTKNLLQQGFHAPGDVGDSAIGFRCAAFPGEG